MVERVVERSVTWVCRAERAFWVVERSVRRRVSASGDESGAGEDVLPRDGVFVIVRGNAGAGDGGGGAARDVVRSASFVTVTVISLLYERACMVDLTGVYVRLMRLLSDISNVECGRVLVDPVGHRSCLVEGCISGVCMFADDSIILVSWMLSPSRKVE